MIPAPLLIIPMKNAGMIFTFQFQYEDLQDMVIRPIDISDAQTKNIVFKRPDATLISKPASFSSDSGVDGKISYVVEEGVIDQPGQWYIQPLVDGPSYFRSMKPEAFEVVSNLVEVVPVP